MQLKTTFKRTAALLLSVITLVAGMPAAPVVYAADEDDTLIHEASIVQPDNGTIALSGTGVTSVDADTYKTTDGEEITVTVASSPVGNIPSGLSIFYSADITEGEEGSTTTTTYTIHVPYDVASLDVASGTAQYTFEAPSSDYTISAQLNPIADGFPVTYQTYRASSDIPLSFFVGSVTVDATTAGPSDFLSTAAAAGKEVTVQVVADETRISGITGVDKSLYDYDISASDYAGNDITLTDAGNGSYTFVMPNSGVSIVLAESYGNIGGGGGGTVLPDVPTGEDVDPSSQMAYYTEWADMENGIAEITLREKFLSGHTAGEIEIASPQIVNIAIDVSGSTWKTGSKDPDSTNCCNYDHYYTADIAKYDSSNGYPDAKYATDGTKELVELYDSFHCRYFKLKEDNGDYSAANREYYIKGSSENVDIRTMTDDEVLDYYKNATSLNDLPQQMRRDYNPDFSPEANALTYIYNNEIHNLSTKQAKLIRQVKYHRNASGVSYATAFPGKTSLRPGSKDPAWMCTNRFTMARDAIRQFLDDAHQQCVERGEGTHVYINLSYWAKKYKNVFVWKDMANDVDYNEAITLLYQKANGNVSDGWEEYFSLEDNNYSTVFTEAAHSITETLAKMAGKQIGDSGLTLEQYNNTDEGGFINSIILTDGQPVGDKLSKYRPALEAVHAYGPTWGACVGMATGTAGYTNVETYITSQDPDPSKRGYTVSLMIDPQATFVRALTQATMSSNIGKTVHAKDAVRTSAIDTTHFDISTVSDISADTGTASVKDGKLVWNIDGAIGNDGIHEAKFRIKLKDEYRYLISDTTYHPLSEDTLSFGSNAPDAGDKRISNDVRQFVVDPDGTVPSLTEVTKNKSGDIINGGWYLTYGAVGYKANKDWTIDGTAPDAYPVLLTRTPEYDSADGKSTDIAFEQEMTQLPDGTYGLDMYLTETAFNGKTGKNITGKNGGRYSYRIDGKYMYPLLLYWYKYQGTFNADKTYGKFTYDLNETSKDDGYIQLSKQVNILKASPAGNTLEYGFDFVNSPMSVLVGLTKTDKYTGALLHGAEFDIYEYNAATGKYGPYYGPDGQIVKIKESAKGDGTYVSTDYLYYKKSNKGLFRAYETVAPAGYMGDWANPEKTSDTPDVNLLRYYDITVPTDTAIAGKTLRITNNANNTFDNIPAYTTITIHKLGKHYTGDENGDGVKDTEDVSLPGAWYVVRLLTENASDNTLKAGSFLGDIDTAHASSIKQPNPSKDINSLDLSWADEEFDFHLDFVPDDKPVLSGEYDASFIKSANFKQDETGKWKIFFDDGTSTSMVYVTGADGTIKLPRVPAGVYEIMEVKAPSGYTRVPSGSAVVCDTRTFSYRYGDYSLPVTFENGQKKVEITPPATNPEEPGKSSKAAISIVKSAPKKVYNQGETVEYSIVVTNSGDLTLHDIDVTDSLTVGSGTPLDEKVGFIESLAPGESKSLTYTYTVPRGTAAGSIIDNIATAAGYALDPDRDNAKLPVSDSDTEKVVVDGGGLSVVKTADKAKYMTGDTVNYTVTVSNSSGLDMENVRVDDFLPGIQFSDRHVEGITGGGGFVNIALLPAHSSVDLNYTFTIPEDFVPDMVDNIVVAKHITGKGEVPSLSVTKEADYYVHKAGDTVTYTVTVYNNGDTELKNIVLNDSLKNITWDDGKNVISRLAPGQSAVKTYTYVIPESAADGHIIDNTVTAKCSAPYKTADGKTASVDLTDSDDASVIVNDSAAALKITKHALKKNATNGESVGFAIRVTNTGSVSLNAVQVEDSLDGGEWLGEPNIDRLDTGESVDLGYVYTVSGFAGGGELLNTARVRGKDPEGNWLTDEDDDTVLISVYGEEEVSDEELVPVASPDISVYKNADKDYYKVGETVHYTIIVTNTGKCDLRDVYVKEMLIDGKWTDTQYDISYDGLLLPSLRKGESVTLHYDYVTKASDNQTAITNYVRAKGISDNGEDDPGQYVEAGDSDTVAVGKYIGVGKLGVRDGFEEFMAGAEIGIFAADEIRNYTTGQHVYSKDDLVYKAVTGKDGFITLPEPLPLGKYYLKELTAPVGCYASDERIDIDATHYADNDNVDTLYVGGWFRNPVTKTVLFLRDDNTWNTLQGATFKITNENGSTVTFLDEDGIEQTSFRTDGTEKGYTIYGLAPDTSYTVVEVAPREGYVNEIVNAYCNESGRFTSGTGNKMISFIIPDTRIVYDANGKSSNTPDDFVMTLTNQIQTGTARLYKTGEVLESWTIVDKVKKLFHSFFNWILGRLSGVTFKVIAREDIEHPDGKTGIIFHAGDVVAEGVTSFRKEAVETTDLSGMAVFEGLYLGKYAFVELAAPDGYILNEAPIDFTIAYGSPSSKVVSAVGGDVNVYNERQHITIEVRKYEEGDKKKKKQLKGAYFTLYNAEAIVDANGNVLVPKNTKLETITSVDGEYHFVSDLPLGKYYIKETKAPKGYEKSDKKITINAGPGKNNYTFTATFYDKKKGKDDEGGGGSTPPGGGGGDDISLVKTGPTTGAQGGLITYTLSTIANTTSHPVSNFVFEDKLANGTFLQTLNTGVYNADVPITVYYRLYGSTDIIKWKENLSSKQNHTLNVAELSSQISAYFNDGQATHTPYVTSFILYFGDVPAGFAATTAPTYTVLVSSMVPVGSTIKNNADLVAKYGDKNYHKVSSVSTLIPLGNGLYVGPVKTGDGSSLVLYIILAVVLLALGVILGIDLRRRKKKKEKQAIRSMSGPIIRNN